MWNVEWTNYDDRPIRLGRFETEAEAIAFAQTLTPDDQEPPHPNLSIEEDEPPVVVGSCAKWALTVSYLAPLGWHTYVGYEPPIDDEESLREESEESGRRYYFASVYARTLEAAKTRFKEIHGIEFSDDQPEVA